MPIEERDLAARATMIRQHLDERVPNMLQQLERFVSVESGSREKDAVDRMGAVYRQVFEELGFTAEVIEQPECGNHLVFRLRGDGTGRVLVLAHLDTVWPSGTLARWPFRVDGNRATGPGAGDMKGGIVQAVFAVRALRDLGLPLPGQLTFFFTGDEELGSPTARAHIERLGRAHDLVLVVEPASIDGEVIAARNGIGAFRVEVTGRSSHAAGGPGASAIHALAAKVVELDRLIDWQRRVMVNVGLIEGGSARQVLAEHAAAWIDLRAPTQQLAGDLLERVRTIVEREHVPGTTATLAGIWTRPPSPQTDVQRAMFERAASLAGALGFELRGRVSSGGSDGQFTAALGIPTLDGLGPRCGEPVSAREYILVDSLAERAALIALLMTQG
jgi:glutamate carboxypeptidase